MARDSFDPDKELSAICNQLWELDENRLVPGEDYEIDLQRYTFYSNKGERDEAKCPLFSFVHDDVFKRPTFKRFMALLDNYSTETGVSEVVTPEEIKENQCFIDAIMETKVMQQAHEVLRERGKVPPDVRGFKHALYDLWFKLYARTRGMGRAAGDSSGFEHVFVGETRGDKDVIGFHNWIQFYLEEKRGNVDYKGWIPPRSSSRKDRQADNTAQLVSLQFTWKGQVKPVGSSFIGTSPEFEMALYTVLYYIGNKGDNHLEIGRYNVNITVHKMGEKLGSSFPIALSQDP
ncbi:poly(U)-specific endoribonuclease-like [Diadema antillarum]|uniref:poly(U)-specific endoribonuclease-like n=1 Tax=Diadema antillarum TaxID=105358 RepID=UPI003A8A8482